MNTTILQRKQVLKTGLIDFIKETTTDENIYSVQSDYNTSFWIYKGVLYDNKIFNIKAAKSLKTSTLKKNEVYYISTITETRSKLFNL